MNEKQAVKFWNAIQSGELIGFLPDTEVSQGGPIEKPTYTSTICDQFDLPFLTVPRMTYGYDGMKSGMHNPNEQQVKTVSSFLRSLADAIESAAKVQYDN